MSLHHELRDAQKNSRLKFPKPNLRIPPSISLRHAGRQLHCSISGRTSRPSSIASWPVIINASRICVKVKPLLGFKSNCCEIATRSLMMDTSSKVAIATGISCPAARLGSEGRPKPSAFARSNSANCASSRILTPLADHTTCKALGFGSELCVSRSGPEGIVIEFDTFLCNCPGSAIWSCWAKSITRPHHRCAVYGFLCIRQRTHTLNALDTHRTHRVCRIRKNSRAVARCSLPC